MPFMFFVKPENIVDLFDKILAKEGINHNNIDILTIDIDSYDYYIVKELLEHEYKPRLFIVEYNPNLPIDQALSYPNTEALSLSKNRKVTWSYKDHNCSQSGVGYRIIDRFM